MSFESAVRRLVDEADIRAVLVRYARSIDHGDLDGVAACYHEDATDAHGAYNGPVAGFLESSRRFVQRVESMTHLLGQSTIELDGDAAWVETYCLCLVRYKPTAPGEPSTERVANIRYVDVFERRTGEWRIARRKLVHHPSRVDPVATDAVLAEVALRAQLDGTDPSYDRRPESFQP